MSDAREPTDYRVTVRQEGSPIPASFRRAVTLIAVGVLAMAFLFGFLVGKAYGQTAGPIQTVPGYPGCGGNNTIQTVGVDGIVCANRRTYTFSGQTRTVTAISTLNADGTGTVSYMIEPAPVPFPVQLRIRAHVGVSSEPNPLTSDVTGVIPAGQQGPVVLHFTYQCGQVDLKAVLTGEGQSAGRISGGYFCVEETPDTTTTTPPTAPTSGPGTSTATTGVTVPTSGIPSTAGRTVTPGTLPATGMNAETLLFAALAGILLGTVIVVVARRLTDV